MSEVEGNLNKYFEMLYNCHEDGQMLKRDFEDHVRNTEGFKDYVDSRRDDWKLRLRSRMNEYESE